MPQAEGSASAKAPGWNEKAKLESGKDKASEKPRARPGDDSRVLLRSVLGSIPGVMGSHGRLFLSSRNTGLICILTLPDGDGMMVRYVRTQGDQLRDFLSLVKDRYCYISNGNGEKHHNSRI